jgi:hypothetical protein
MTAERFLRELTWPLTELVVLLAIVAFSLFATLASAAGSLSIWIGIWLGIVLMPGLFRYLLMLLEAKAYGRTTPVANIELFSFISNLWSLTWLVICAVTIWGGILLAAYISLPAAQVFALLSFAMLPGSLAVLAITRSPFASLHPRTVARMIAVSGWQYWLVPVAVGIMLVIAGQLATSGAPGWLVTISRFYCLFLLFTLTGGLLHANGVRFSLSFDGSAGDGDDTELPPVRDERTRLRTRVLTHAYGFFSRDNRAGALAHIECALRDDEDVDGAWQWYFNEMLNWESKDGALMLAQSRLTRLLNEKRDVEAMKLISRCLLENSRFRPLPQDQDAALEAAERLHRDDLAKALE